MRKAYLAALLTGLIALACVGCRIAADSDPYHIGVGRGDDGGPLAVIYSDCGNNIKITSVMVARDRAEPLWRISSSGSSLRSFVVGGTTPDGFVTDVPLDKPLTGRYFVSVDSTYKRAESYSFSTPDLRSGVFLFGDGRYLTLAEFQSGMFC